MFEHGKEACIYLAGFFDGEGTVGIYGCASGARKKQPVFRACLCNNVKAPLELAREMFGGRIRLRLKQYKNGISRNWEWYVDGQNAEMFLHTIQPYCIVKRCQVDAYLQARTLLPGKGNDLTREKWEALAEAELLLKKMKKEVSL